jgi:two-component system cell cycle response regulator
MVKNIQSGLKVVNSLAEITSYKDKHLLEDSLVKTIQELLPGGGQRLFSVMYENKVLSIKLRAYSESADVNSTNAKINENLLITMFKKVIKTKTVEVFPCEDKINWHIVYPEFDANKKIFAILLYTCKNPNITTQQTLNGIFRVYANYLRLLDKSERDKLTGLYNRETLDNQIIKVLVNGTEESQTPNQEEERRASDQKYTFLGIIDIDHFKSINDNLGHLYGDDILVLVARLLTESFTRECDLVFRYGGEEFVILITSSSTEEALKAFERLRLNIQNYQFPQLDQLTVSIGFEKITHQISPHDVIAAADKALYFAKESGRNRTEFYPSLIAEGKLLPNNEIDTSPIVFF